MEVFMTNLPSRRDNALREQGGVGKANFTSGFNLTDLSTKAQRQRILFALRHGPVSTIGARRDLAVMHPAMRVLELRLMGYAIDLVWRREADELGIVHRQGLYILKADLAEEVQL